MAACARVEVPTVAQFVAAGEHNGVVVNESGLLSAVDAVFEITGRGLAPWPDPHPNRSPLDEEYSRLNDPAKWRIIGARADAWLVALVDSALVTADRDALVQWRVEPATVISQTDRVVPVAPVRSRSLSPIVASVTSTTPVSPLALGPRRSV